MAPGATVLTLTPAAAHSLAALSLNVCIPPRAAPECAKLGQPCQMVCDHIHDCAAVLLHPARVDLAHEDETAGQIGAHDRLEPLGRDRLQRSAILAAGIVDEAVDAAAFSEHCLDRRDYPCFLANVADVDARLAAIGANFASDPAEFVGVATDQCHLRAQIRQFVRGAAANATAATGHDDDLVREQAGT